MSLTAGMGSAVQLRERIADYQQECLRQENEIQQLREQLAAVTKERDELIAKVDWMEGNTPNWGWPWDAPYTDGYETAKNEFRKEIIEVEEQLVTCKKECESLRADAERYRYIRKAQGHYGFEVIKRSGMFGDKQMTGKKLDAAVDAAMQKEKDE